MRTRKGQKLNLRQLFSILWSTALATLFLYALLYSNTYAATLKVRSNPVCVANLASYDDEEPGMGDVVTIKPDPVEKQTEIDPRTIPQPELPLQIVPNTPPKEKIKPPIAPFDPVKIKKPDPKWNIN